MELKRVVVTGLGALTPVGNTVAETWENLKKGVSGAGPITHFDASKFKTQFACEVKGFKAADYIDRKEARKMDLYEQYALVAAMEAVKDSGMNLEAVDKNRIGVILGVGIGGIHTFEEEAGNYAVNGAEMGPKYNPFFIPKMIADIDKSPSCTVFTDPTSPPPRHAPPLPTPLPTPSISSVWAKPTPS